MFSAVARRVVSITTLNSSAAVRRVSPLSSTAVNNSAMKKARTAMQEISNDGAFKRTEATFRNWIKKDSTEFPPEANRYHLYVSYACPWVSLNSRKRERKGIVVCH